MHVRLAIKCSRKNRRARCIVIRALLRRHSDETISKTAFEILLAKYFTHKISRETRDKIRLYFEHFSKTFLKEIEILLFNNRIKVL